jgi:hypothetical protein
MPSDFIINYDVFIYNYCKNINHAPLRCPGQNEVTSRVREEADIPFLAKQ